MPSSVMKKEDIEGVFAVCYTGNAERHSRLMRELGRVGFNDVNVIWSFPTPYRQFVLKRIPHIKEMDAHPGYWGATIGQYYAIKTAYHLGMTRALIVEDDCRFLKDKDRVWSVLNDVPNGCDIIMLDHFSDGGLSGSGVFRTCVSAQSTACYIVGRRAMAKLVSLYESPVSGKFPRPVMRNCDHWQDRRYLGSGINICCAVPNVAVQVDCHDVVNSVPGHIHGEYAKMGLNMDDYEGW